MNINKTASSRSKANDKDRRKAIHVYYLFPQLSRNTTYEQNIRLHLIISSQMQSTITSCIVTWTNKACRFKQRVQLSSNTLALVLYKPVDLFNLCLLLHNAL